jgi:hypothetical protein
LRLARVASALLALAAVGLAAAGCGGTSRESAGRFVTRILREEISGQWAAQWEDLHPGQQKLITQDQYVLCSERIGTNVGVKQERFTVHGIKDVPFHEQGVPERTSKLVTISVAGPAMNATFHVHAVLHTGRWRWVLGPALLKSVSQGRCLDGSQLSGTT